MTAATPEDGSAIVQRGCRLGGAWGPAFGIVLLAVIAVQDRTPGELVLFPFAALVGAVIGTIAGTVSGMALSLAERLWRPTNCRRRAVGSLASGLSAPFCILWLAAGELTWLLVVGLIGAVAGALLGPRAVHGNKASR